MENNITNIILNYSYNSITQKNSSSSYLNNQTDIIHINKNINEDNFLNSSSITKKIYTTIPFIEEKVNNKENNLSIKGLNNSLNSELAIIETNNIINNTNYVNKSINDSINSLNNNKIIMSNIIDKTILNILTDYIKENDNIINNISQSHLNLSNNTNSKNDTNSSKYPRTIKDIPKHFVDSMKKMDKKYITAMEIVIPLVILIIIIFCIVYRIKRRKKNQLIQEKNEIEKNGLNFQNSANKVPYNRIENTSGFNVGLNPNNFSMSEIKVQNLKDEIHNIITNKSGGSNSSGKRKREKRKMGNNKNLNISEENNRGIQNEMKEEIKQYVIDEQLNKN